jgi:hypothetical protein
LCRVRRLGGFFDDSAFATTSTDFVFGGAHLLDLVDFGRIWMLTPFDYLIWIFAAKTTTRPNTCHPTSQIGYPESLRIRSLLGGLKEDIGAH